MGKITRIILSVFIFFSIANIGYANNLSIDKTLDFYFGLEDRKLNLDEINKYSYKDYSKTKMLNDFIYLDGLMRGEITRLYRNEDIDYNKMNGIISNYNKFIYHINKYFYYEYLSEISNYSEISIASDRNFEFARGYFQKTKNIIRR